MLIRSFIAAALAPFDLRDGILALGLLLLAVGLSFVSAALAFGIPGAILVYVAIFSGRTASASSAPNEDE